MTWNLRTVGVSTFLVFAGLVGCANPQNEIAGLKTDGQIIGGEEATGQEDFTKSVALLYDAKNGSLCTASILSDSILLTAAHCVEGDAQNYVVGFLLSMDDQEPEVRPVTDYAVSPIWPVRQNQVLNNGDIALVRFDGGLPEGYVPAQIMTDISVLKDGQTIMLAGYGNSDGAAGTGAGRLRFVETTIKNLKYSKSEILIEQSKGKGACHGDSGGPAYASIGGKLAVFGVTSRGVDDPNNDCSVSAAYTSVAYYATWITRTAKALNQRALLRPAAPALAATGS